MSETTSEPCGSWSFPLCLGLYANGAAPPLPLLCDHIVNWVVSFESTINRVHYAEANCMSEADVTTALEEEEQALLEIECLAVAITAMHAANQVEIEGKQRALNGLTSIPAWERDSLFALRCSIERDQVEVNARLLAAPAPPAQRRGWLSRSTAGAPKG